MPQASQDRCCNPNIQDGHKISPYHFGMRCPSCGYLIRGRKIAGKYEIVKLIDEGGFNEVYEVQEVTRLNRTLVLKIPSAMNIGKSAGITKEAGYLSSLAHNNVLPVYDIGRLDDDNRTYIIVARAKGTLEENFLDTNRQPIKAQAEDLIPYVQQAAKALHHIHEKGFIHQDVKPKNLLLGEDGQILLADLGTAQSLGSDSHKETETISGTPPYWAPEQLRGELRREIDQYALAVSIYELLAGRRPFEYAIDIELRLAIKNEKPPRPMQWNPRIPLEVEPVLLRALAKDYRQRYSSILEFADAYVDAVERAKKRYRCQKCFHQNRTGAHRCGGCGTQDDNRYCPYCDNTIRFGQRFCPSCGRLTISNNIITNSSLIGMTAQRGRYVIKQVLKDANRMVIAIAKDTQANDKLVILKRKQFNEYVPVYKTDVATYIAKTESLTKIRHPLVPPVIDRFFEGVCHYMVLPYIQGESIDERLQRMMIPLSEREVIYCLNSLLNVLIVLERQSPPLHHYDISPHNIIIESIKGRAMLTGFPIGSQQHDLPRSSLYMPAAPDPPDQRSCIYALAATMHHALTNIAPSPQGRYQSVKILNPDISAELDTIIMRSLAIDPSTRYQSYEEMRQGIQPLLLSLQNSATLLA